MKKNIARTCYGLGLASIIAFGLTAQAEGLFGITLDKLTPDFVKPTLHKLFPKTTAKNFVEKDEAKLAEEAGNLSAQQKQILFQGSSNDYFRDMDYGITKRPADAQRILSGYVPGITPEKAVERMARGRNNWIVWTFGNDRFWSDLGRATLGGLDFIKTLSSHPNIPSSRSNRWKTLGLVNEPCFKQSAGPRADRWGLYLDERIVSPECPADPFEDAAAYPGIKIGSRGTILKYKGKNVPFEVGSMYGYATGVVGLRLFPNPEFDQKAADKWDPVKYYNDPNYFTDPKLVRPFRVGMSCAFCHVGPNPSNPPADFNNPTWANLNSNPGAQYFWFDRIFTWNWKKTKAQPYASSEDSFVFQFVHSFRPGALDTSLVSSDQINNARTMNAVYDLRSRVNTAIKFNQTETLKGEETLTSQFRKMGSNMLPEASPLRTTSKDMGGSELVVAPRVLKDGSDSVGALGALNRVYVNIGLFSEEWVNHFIPLIGGASLTPFPIRSAQENSLYWQANVQQTPDLALFFLGSAQPDKLEVAPGGKAYLKDMDSPEVSMGKKVFAENCAACHSTKIPEKGYSYFKNPTDPGFCQGKNYMQCWENYWKYTQSEEFKGDMLKIVEQKDFLENNFLSNDLRVPVTLTDSQLCSPVATNGIKGDIWDNFTSSTYKTLPTVGKFVANYPVDGSNKMTPETLFVPDGGRGFLRPASLISLWSSAPFLQNNTLGKFDDRGTVEGRMLSFDDSIHKLLNPEQRANPDAPQVSGKDTKQVYYKTNLGYTLPGDMDVTRQVSYVKLPKSYVPKFVQAIIDPLIALNPFAKKNFIKKGFEYVTFPGDDSAKVAKKDKDKKDTQKNRDTASEEYGWSAEDDPKLMGEEYKIGPIPAGVPVNLIVNLNLAGDPINKAKLSLAIGNLVRGIIASKGKPAAEALDIFMRIAAPSLIAVSKCNDFVVNRGHYFGSQYDPRLAGTGSKGLSPDEKSALIEYLKHF